MNNRKRILSYQKVPFSRPHSNFKASNNQKVWFKVSILGAEVPLMFAPVEPKDFTFLHFYEEFVWLVEFSVITAFIVFVTEQVPEQFKWKV